MAKWRRRRYQLTGTLLVGMILIIIGLPALLVRGCNWRQVTLASSPRGQTVKVQLAPGRIVTMPLDDYLIGVVAAEMPPEFEMEALKAQAVAARTYTLLRISGVDNDGKHKNAQLCTDPAHCQAYFSTEQMHREWGVDYGRNYSKVKEAVLSTEGEVLAYQSRLIDPVYHASCGGQGTEDAAAVWGSPIPYLKGVPCHWDPPERQQPVETAMAMKDVLAKLGMKDQAIPVSSGSHPVQVLERDSSGRVSQVQIGGQIFKGTDLRKSLGLRSTSFTVKISGSNLNFSTRGYGHAVGMCQYGAQGMAEEGRNYKEILTYYYRGAVVTGLSRVKQP